MPEVALLTEFVRLLLEDLTHEFRNDEPPPNCLISPRVQLTLWASGKLKSGTLDALAATTGRQRAEIAATLLATAKAAAEGEKGKRRKKMFVKDGLPLTNRQLKKRRAS